VQTILKSKLKYTAN